MVSMASASVLVPSGAVPLGGPHAFGDWVQVIKAGESDAT